MLPFLAIDFPAKLEVSIVPSRRLPDAGRALATDAEIREIEMYLMKSPDVTSPRRAMRRRRAWPLAGLLLLAMFGPGLLQAADGEDNPGAEDDPEAAEFEASLLGEATPMDSQGIELVGNPMPKMFSRWPEDLVIAPVPGRSPQIGWNLSLGAAYFLDKPKAGSETPPSIFGLFGKIAENGSYAYGGGTKLHLLNDNLRIVVGGGYGDVRYRYYGIGNSQGDLNMGLDILQRGPVFSGKASWRVWKKIYAGIGYMGGNIETRVRFAPNVPSSLFDPTLDVDVRAFTIPIEIDSRDHQQFPHSGWLVKLNSVFYRKSLGSDFDSETFKLVANHYRPMRGEDVLATRFVLRGTGEGAPFFVLSSFGGSTDLRGYPSGRYRDRMMYALQSEYRWQMSDRWVMTGFAGFGEVAEAFSDFGDNLLPATGVGLRYVLSAKHRVSLSLDAAVGNDGGEYYFGVNEAF